MDTNNKINCNVKLYFNRKKNLHFYRYPLKAEAVGVKINKDGIEVPSYKERRLRSDEYVNRDFYKTFPFHIPGENGKLSHTKERDNRLCRTKRCKYALFYLLLLSNKMFSLIMTSK